MKPEGIRAALEDDVFDSALVHLSYVDYLRDFQMYFYIPTSVRENFTLRYRFINCVLMNSETSLPSEQWKGSLDDNLISEIEDVVQPEIGWVWATRYASMYPGATFFEFSDAADRWTEALGVKFYEAQFEADPLRLKVVFSDLVVEEVRVGHSPYIVD